MFVFVVGGRSENGPMTCACTRLFNVFKYLLEYVENKGWALSLLFLAFFSCRVTDSKSSLCGFFFIYRKKRNTNSSANHFPLHYFASCALCIRRFFVVVVCPPFMLIFFLELRLKCEWWNQTGVSVVTYFFLFNWPPPDNMQTFRNGRGCLFV